jgi:hypothetical protein
MAADTQAGPGSESPEQTVARLHRNKRIFDQVAVQQSRILLARARAAQPDIWNNPDPLVTVRITTYNRPKLLVERAIASVLRQTYQNFEILVVGDHAVPETADALAAIGDPRIRYFNLPERGRYPRFPRYFWSSAGALASIWSFDLCRGEWVTNLDDDDEYPPDHIQVLLHAARTARAEFVFGVSEYEKADGTWIKLGRFVWGQICSGSVMFSARLLQVRPEQFSWVNDEPGDWNMWRRMSEAGAVIGFVNHVVFRHFAEKSSAGATAADRKRLDEQKATPQEILDDVAYAGASRYLSLE